MQDGAGMKAKKNFTKIDCLASKLGKKVPVDVAAVVTAVGPLGSVKRQADGTEFVRRCVAPPLATRLAQLCHTHACP